MGTVKTKLKPGLFISPGYYSKFWQDKIESVFTEQQILSSPFKPYRELWVGAPLAAAYSKAHDAHYFIEMPRDEPPDVNIVRFLPTFSKSGRSGVKCERLPVEVVRCNVSQGEDLYSQIMLKNTPAYNDMSVAVYIFGGGETADWDVLNARLNSVEMHMSEVKVVGKIDAAGSTVQKDGTFVVVNVYPELSHQIVSLEDRSAFFRFPAILREGEKRYSTILKKSGKLDLLPPI